jgi:hypothetical protein
MIFGVSKLSCGKDFPAYSYGEFLCAFKMASVVTALDEDASSEFSDAIHKVANANFLNEYVFYYYNQDGWFHEPGLRTDEFRNWAKINLADHVPISSNAVSVEQGQTEADETEVSEIELNSDVKQSVGNFSYVSEQRYEKPSFGVSLKFDIVGNDSATVDFYIYPKLPKENELLKRNGLVDEATSAKIGIIYYAQENKADSMEVVQETSNDDISFLKGVYKIEVNNTRFIEELYISGNEKYFLKARSTYIEGTERNYNEQEIKNLFESLLVNVFKRSGN